MEEKNNRIKDVIKDSLENLSDLINVNCVIGKPINNDNDVIIPITKVTFGVLCGGGEYGKVTIFKNGADLPYSAGNGSIVSVKPCGFLIKMNDNYKVVSVGDATINSILDKATDYLESLNNEN